MKKISTYAANKAKKREKQKKATETFDELIKSQAERDNISYGDAFVLVARQWPKLYQLWSDKKGL